MAEEKFIGKIIHYYPKISVGIIELDDELKVGDKVHIKGKDNDFEQAIGSIQIEHANVDYARKGDSVGIKIDNKVKEGDFVYLVK